MLSLLKDVADEVITPRFRRSPTVSSREAAGDLVTDADREAEVLITAALVAAYPDAVVLGEEIFAGDPALMDRYAVTDHAFTVDPVDGTKNFVHGSKDHAVMVGVTVAGEVVRAWIWQPQHEGRRTSPCMDPAPTGETPTGRKRLTVPEPATTDSAAARRAGVDRPVARRASSRWT